MRGYPFLLKIPQQLAKSQSAVRVQWMVPERGNPANFCQNAALFKSVSVRQSILFYLPILLHVVVCRELDRSGGLADLSMALSAEAAESMKQWMDMEKIEANLMMFLIGFNSNSKKFPQEMLKP